MTSDSTDWIQEAELDPEKEYRALVRSIRWTRGFGLLFVQCSPAEGSRLIARVREDLPEKKVEVLSLRESIDNLYDEVDALPNKDQIDVLFIQGLEYSLYEYEKTQLWDEPSDRYTYSDKGIPRILGNLNLGRERLAESFKFCFVFLVPLFALKYLARRSPDFFDWRSGVLEFHTDPKIIAQESLQFLNERTQYLGWTQPERNQQILKIQAWLEECHQIGNLKSKLLFEQLRLLSASGEYESMILTCEKILLIEPNSAKIWSWHGALLGHLKDYAQAIVSLDKSLQLEPNNAGVLGMRGALLFQLGRYEEMVADADCLLKINSESIRAWHLRVVALWKLERIEETINSLDKCIQLCPDDHENLVWQGLLFSSLGQYKKAIANLEKALTLQPDDQKVLYSLASFRGMQGHIRLATKTLKRAIALNPKYRQIAATDSAFDSIRNDDRFQALINEAES